MNDLALALRRLRRAPGFSFSVILTLALGIGATTALFSVAQALVFGPLPLPRAHEIVVPISHTNNGQYFLCSVAELERWRTAAKSFASIGAALAQSSVLSRRGAPELLRSAKVDAEYFATLGITPVLGRVFTSHDGVGDSTGTAVLGYDLWKARFGGDGAVLGEQILLDDHAFTIIGVLPPGLDLPSGTQVYIPFDRSAAAAERTRYTHNLWIVARLKPTRSVQQADTELKTLCSQLTQENPEQHRNWTALALPLRNHLLEDNERTIEKRLRLLGGAVGLLLLIACANAANLVLARSLHRERELATRVALGASPWSNVRLVIAENVLLAALGSALGLVLAGILTPALFALSPVKALAMGSIVGQPRIDWRVLLAVAGVATATVPLFSLPAVLRAVRLHPWAAIQAGPRGQGGSSAGARVREFILAATIALSLALLSASAIIWRSYFNVRHESLGFDPREVVSVRVGLTGPNYENPEKRWSFLSRVLADVRALPGVTSAGMANRIPLHIEGWSESFVMETGPLAGREEPNLVVYRVVSPGYLETIGARLLLGRLINDDDRPATQRVVVVNQTFAEAAWPAENAIGKRLRRYRGAPDEWLTVVGVVADIKEPYIGGLRANRQACYLAYPQRLSRSAIHIVAKGAGDGATLLKAIDAAVHRADSGQPVFEAVRLEEHVRNSTADEQFVPFLVGSFSICGLLLAALGIYGLTDYLVQRRLPEIGIRLALGASRGSIYWIMLRRSLAIFSLGAAIGIGISLLQTRLFAALLHKVSATEPTAFAVSTIALGVVVLLATALPARRAAKTDPLASLRAE
jgi:putative ABC transport system permease protein